MINKEKMAVYQKYAGDIDRWARMASVAEKTLISDADWYEINSFIQDYSLVKNGLASQRYADKLDKRIEAATSSSEDRQALKTLMMQLA
jgi:hypothetical protein